MVKKLYSCTFVFLVVVLLHSKVKAQLNANLDLSTITKTNSWTPLFSNATLQVNYLFEACNDVQNGIKQEKVLLQWINLSPKKVKIEWQYKLWYDGKCFGCDGNTEEFIKSIELGPLESVQGNCSLNRQSTVIFSKMLDQVKTASLTGFSINDLSIVVQN